YSHANVARYQIRSNRVLHFLILVEAVAKCNQNPFAREVPTPDDQTAGRDRCRGAYARHARATYAKYSAPGTERFRPALGDGPAGRHLFGPIDAFDRAPSKPAWHR